MAVNVVVRGKWKPVELEPSLFLKKDMNHLICIEELTDYSVLDRNSAEVCFNSLFSNIAQTISHLVTHLVLLHQPES